MVPRSFPRLIRVLAVVWIAAAVLAALVYGIFFSPLSPVRQCTLIGCQDMLELSLSSEPPGPYTLLLTSSTGDTRSITCTPGVNELVSDSSAMCRSGTIDIYNFTPSQLTLQLTWQSGSYSAAGQPAYQTFQPNGPGCPPSCRVGRLQVQLP